VIGYLGYEPVVGLIFSDQTLYDGLYPLLILISPLTILAGFVGVDQLLLQSGRAGAYTSVLACGFVVNIGLNYIFIPHIGLSGAAVATATCFSATTLALLALFCVGEGWRPRWRSH
jgi:O-antigen/teichoic acid export membrane protein